MIFSYKKNLLRLTIEGLSKKAIIVTKNKLKIHIYDSKSYITIILMFIIIILLCFIDFGKTGLTFFIVDDKDLSDRISNISTIIGLSLTISTLLINNLASKKKEYYELLFEKTKIFPIVYFAVGLLVFLLAASLFKRSEFLPKYFITNTIITGYYLTIVLILSIAYLFNNITKVYNQTYLKNELFVNFKKKIREERLKDIIHFFSKSLYSDLLNSTTNITYILGRHKIIDLDLTDKYIKDVNIKKLMGIINSELNKDETFKILYFTPLGLYKGQQDKIPILYIDCNDNSFERLKKEITSCYILKKNNQYAKFNEPQIFRNTLDNIVENLKSSNLDAKEFEDSMHYLIESITVYAETGNPLAEFLKTNNFTPSFLTEGINLFSIELIKNINKHSDYHVEFIIASVYRCILKSIFRHYELFGKTLQSMIYIYTKNPKPTEQRSIINKNISEYLFDLEIWKIIHHDNAIDIENKIKFAHEFYFQYAEYLFTILNKVYFEDWQVTFKKFKKSDEQLVLNTDYAVSIQKQQLELRGDLGSANLLIFNHQYRKRIFEIRTCIEFSLQSWLFFLIENKKNSIETKWLDTFNLRHISSEELFTLFFNLLDSRFENFYIGIENWDHIEDRENFTTYSPPQASYWLFQGLLAEVFRRGIIYVNIDLIEVNSWALHLSEKANQIFKIWERDYLIWFDLLKCHNSIEFKSKEQHILNIISKLYEKYQIEVLKDSLNDSFEGEIVREIHDLINKQMVSYLSDSNVFGITDSLTQVPYSTILENLEFYQIIPNSKRFLQTGASSFPYSELISNTLSVNLEFRIIKQILDSKARCYYNQFESALSNTILNLHKKGYLPTIILMGRTLFYKIVDNKNFEYYIPKSSRKYSGFYYGVPIDLLDAEKFNNVLIVANINNAFDLQIGRYSENDIVKLDIDIIEEHESEKILTEERDKWKQETNREISDEEALLKIRNSLKFKCLFKWQLVVKNKNAYEISEVVPVDLEKDFLPLLASVKK